MDWTTLEPLSVGIVAILPPPTWVACGLALLLAVRSWQGYTRLRRTTLGAPCLWAALSACCLAAGTWLAPQLSQIGQSALEFTIAASTLCPLMAVLGAKRPQDRGWQWVVLTLWLVLAWPAAQAVLLPAGIRVELFIAWKLFLWGLIAIGLLNYLPTGNWLAALLVTAGQLLLLREHLGLGGATTWHGTQPLAVGCLLAATFCVARRAAVLPPTTPPAASIEQLTANWLRFRDGFGAFWALRVLGRVNHAAQLRHWPLELCWSDFIADEDQQLSEEHVVELEKTLQTLLRRFVATSDAPTTSS